MYNSTMSRGGKKTLMKKVTGDPTEVSDAIKEKARVISNCTKIPFNKVIEILCEQNQNTDIENLQSGLLRKIS
jgi:hypothetical protein